MAATYRPKRNESFLKTSHLEKVPKLSICGSVCVSAHEGEMPGGGGGSGVGAHQFM